MKTRIACALGALLCVLSSVRGSSQAPAFSYEVHQLTTGPSHHFYGYIGHVGNSPYSADGKYLVALRTTFQDRMPGPQDVAEIVLLDVENHHNFAWREQHVLPDGSEDELIVHRKGATPAGQGVLGIIPGSMGTPGYVVRGKGVAASLNSASHGAGRCMSRTAAKSKFTWNSTQKNLAKRGIRVLSAGADEVPGVYKNIEDVMYEQQDLVEKIARFDPKVVKRCGDGSQAED